MPSPKATTAAPPEKWYTIRAQARPAAGVNAHAHRAEILIYGDIGESWYGDTIAAKDFVREVGAAGRRRADRAHQQLWRLRDRWHGDL